MDTTNATAADRALPLLRLVSSDTGPAQIAGADVIAELIEVLDCRLVCVASSDASLPHLLRLRRSLQLLHLLLGR